jgi:hypothetical protein
VKFRVTYWPGTAQFPGSYVKWMAENDLIKDYEKIKFFDFDSYKDAQSYTAGAYMGTSDGCLIEYVKECDHCKEEYFTNAEDSKLCHECGDALTLA